MRTELDVPDRLIEGVRIRPLVQFCDDRGDLVELLSLRDDDEAPIVHVYRVTAAPGSVRAWVYHEQQDDRLAFTEGVFRLVLYDLRPESPTYGLLNVLDVGAAQRCIVTLPPLVVHGLKNIGTEASGFTNMPTRIYDRTAPDKWRLPPDHPGIPYSFE